MTPAETARTFAEALLGGHGELLSGCWITVTSIRRSDPGPRTTWVPATADALVGAASAAAGGTDITGVYVGVGLTRAKPSRAKRLDVAATAGLAYLWADIDVAGGGHCDKAYPPTRDAAVGVANSLGLRPTTVTDTGHGIQAFWRLNEPWIFGAVDADDDGVPIIDPDRIDADRAAAKTLAWEFVTSLRIKASQMGGWYVDPVGDLARLMRVAGTCNRKVVGEELPVTVRSVDPGISYAREDIEVALAPRTLLDAYRYDQVAATASLVGVDLTGLWAEVAAAPAHTPRWLSTVLESGWDPVLEAIFTGLEDKRYGNDDSRIDMALVAAALRMQMTNAQAVQIVMSRRMRIGRRIEKVDPSERVSYLENTVGKVVARIDALGVVAASYEAGLEAIMAGPDPVVPAPVAAPVLADVAPESDEPPPEGEPVSLRASAPVDIVAARTEREHKAGKPRLGLDATTPDRPDETQKAQGSQLAELIGLPLGVYVWGAGIRRQENHDEVRLWLIRDARSSDVHGGRWGIGEVASTRWHPKSTWDNRAMVASLVFHDMHLRVEPVPQRRWGGEGVDRLYELAQEMWTSTPQDTARQGIVTLLRRSSGTSAFSMAVATRDPWLSPEDEVWVPLDSVRHSITQMGFTPQKAELLYDTLDSMRCKVERLEVVEGYRTVRDELQWVRVDESLMDEKLAADITAAAVQRDAEDRRSDLRVIGPS